MFVELYMRYQQIKKYLTTIIDLSIKFIRDLFNSSFKHDVPGTAAEGAYRAILSFFPFLMVMVSLLSQSSHKYNLVDELMELLRRFLLPNSITIIQSYLENFVNIPVKTIISVSIFAFFWFGTVYFCAIGKGIAKAYGLSVRPLWRDLFIHFMLFVFTGVFLVAFSALMILGPIILKLLNVYIEVPKGITFLLGKLRIFTSVVGLIILLSTIYHISLPKPSSWFTQLPGAACSATAWVISTGAFSLYLQHFGLYEKTYGSLAGLIIFLVWLYISNGIFIMGAEINHTLDNLIRDYKKNTN
ncbi:MAG: YihY/virulence factor BrkB family protein [Candidatus Coatesbacteria bacterium]|nr:YihY/virulence factor BrkB family protein [Candidatus Coatesbacteria bacterium]